MPEITKIYESNVYQKMETETKLVKLSANLVTETPIKINISLPTTQIYKNKPESVIAKKRKNFLLKCKHTSRLS